ncbi:MAG: tRNA (guanosine(37)-N1)-methyltransferase TrmD [Gammaproteobacteria bacterium]
MKAGIVTLFPEMFTALQYGIMGRTLRQSLVTLTFWNPRDYTQDTKHRTVDDRPYGGGPGMVMQVQPIYDAVLAAKKELGNTTPVIYLSPQGKVITQKEVKYIAASRERMIFISGRYEGVDERLISTCVEEEWSIGDYVLSGGELPTMVLIDAITRLLPGALGHEDSAEQDSFTEGLLDYPHYTRPEVVQRETVPSVLLSGDHEAIRRWRLKQSLGRTWIRRPDLLAQRALNDEESTLLAEFILESKT